MSVESIQNLKLRTFISTFRAESAALWFLCLYITFEYIRPQQMYSQLNIIPWGMVTILLCVVSVFLTGNKAKGVGAMDKMFIIFSLIVLWSGIFAWMPEYSLKGWTTYASWVLLYFCVVSILTTPNRILLFAIFFIIINFKLSQHGARSFAMRGFTFTQWGLAGAPGWFHNSGEFSLQMVVMFSMSTSLLLAFREYVQKPRRWLILLFLFPGTAFLTVVGASSRGGQIALLAVIIIFLLKQKRIFKKLLIIGILLAIGLSLLPESQKERFDTMGKDQTSELRITHWENAIDTIKKNPLGIGYNNWIPYYASHYDPPKVEQVHNSILQAFVDLGYPGGILFLVMVFSSFIMNGRTIREMNEIGGLEEKSIAAVAKGVNLGLLGTIIAAFFMSVLFYPMFWLAFALTSSMRHVSKKRISIYKESRVPAEETQLRYSTAIINK